MKAVNKRMKQLADEGEHYFLPMKFGFFGYASTRDGDLFRHPKIKGLRLVHSGASALIERQNTFFGRKTWFTRQRFEWTQSQEYAKALEEIVKIEANRGVN